MPVYLAMTLLATVPAYFACRVRAAAPAGVTLSQRSARKTTLIYFALVIGSALPFVLVSGFRYDVGTDYFFTYEPLISGMNAGYVYDHMIVEPGYWFLCRSLSFFGLGITWLMLISTVMTVAFFWLAFYGQSDIPWLSVFLFAGARFFFISMNGVRQYMAMAVGLFAFRFIKEKCLWKYALCICAAAVLFHASALLFLPLYFLRWLRLNPFVAGGIVVALFVLRGPLQTLLRFLVEKTPYGEFYMGTSYDREMQPYMEKFWAMLPLFLAGSAYYFVGDNKNNPLFRVYYACQTGVLFLAVFHNIVPQTERISWMCEIPLLLFVPMLLKGEKRLWLRILVGAAVIGGLLWLTWFEIFHSGYHEVVPYRCVFFPELGVL